jgi:hypothetical protein
MSILELSLSRQRRLDVNTQNPECSHRSHLDHRSGHELFTTRGGAGHTLAHVNAADPTSAMSFGPERTDVAVPPSFTTSEQPTRQLSVAGSTDHCANCGAPLASDQHYCVNCGERRGKARFTLAVPQDEDVQVTVTRSSSSAPRRPRVSSSFSLIAGIATLLLAMGVGVLIGHNNSGSGSGKAPATQVITVNGGGTPAASSGAAAPTGSASAGTSSATKGKKGGSAKGAKAAPKVVVQKAAAAASKVTGGSAKVADPTAQQGSSCQSGTAGCQGGKLTGNFFGQ